MTWYLGAFTSELKDELNGFSIGPLTLNEDARSFLPLKLRRGSNQLLIKTSGAGPKWHVVARLRSD